MKKKLRSRSGETLTETIVAVLIIALASAILASMLSAASKMNKQAQTQDEKLYSYISTAETTASSGDVTVTVGTDTITFARENGGA